MRYAPVKIVRAQVTLRISLPPDTLWEKRHEKNPSSVRIECGRRRRGPRAGQSRPRRDLQNQAGSDPELEGDGPPVLAQRRLWAAARGRAQLQESRRLGRQDAARLGPHGRAPRE